MPALAVTAPHSALPERVAASNPAVAQIPLNDLRRQMDQLGDAIAAAVEKVVASGWYVLGPNVTAFETEFADYCGARHCIGVSNGTDALELALRALGCGPGSEVVTVANAGMYASAAILAVGARPVLADIEPDSMTLAPASLANAALDRQHVRSSSHILRSAGRHRRNPRDYPSP